MQTTHKILAKTASTKREGGSRKAGPDAIALLKADHAEVKKCFQAYDKLVKAHADASERQALADQICMLLTVHATIKEEIFYPAAREVLGKAEELVDEADVEHATAKDLIAQILDMSPNETLYDAKVKVLGEYIDHHVKEEQDEMFPKCAKSDMDLKAIGEALAERKEELLAETA